MMEIYTDAEFAKKVLLLASSFNIDAQIIGRVVANDKKELVIDLKEEKLLF
mgnify:FL=1